MVYIHGIQYYLDGLSNKDYGTPSLRSYYQRKFFLCRIKTVVKVSFGWYWAIPDTSGHRVNTDTDTHTHTYTRYTHTYI